jgi:hypothetical protein
MCLCVCFVVAALVPLQQADPQGEDEELQALVFQFTIQLWITAPAA